MLSFEGTLRKVRRDGPPSGTMTDMFAGTLSRLNGRYDGRNGRIGRIKTNPPAVQGAESEQAPIVETFIVTPDPGIRTDNPKYCHPNNWVGRIESNENPYGTSQSSVVYSVVNRYNYSRGGMAIAGEPVCRVEESITNLDMRSQIQVVGVVQNPANSKGGLNGQDDRAAVQLGGTRTVNNTGPWVIEVGDIVYALPIAWSVPGSGDGVEAGEPVPRISALDIVGVSPKKLFLQTIALGPHDLTEVGFSTSMNMIDRLMARIHNKASSSDKPAGARLTLHANAADVWKSAIEGEFASLMQTPGFSCFIGLVFWVLLDVHLQLLIHVNTMYAAAIESHELGADGKKPSTPLRQLVQAMYDTSKAALFLLHTNPAITGNDMERYRIDTTRRNDMVPDDMQGALRISKGQNEAFDDMLKTGKYAQTYLGNTLRLLIRGKDAARKDVDIVKQRYLLGRANSRAEKGRAWVVDIKQSK